MHQPSPCLNLLVVSRLMRLHFLIKYFNVTALVRVYQKLGFIPYGTDVRPIETALEAALPDVLNTDISELNFKNVGE